MLQKFCFKVVCFFLSSCFYVFLFRFFSAECFPMNMFVLWNDKTITWEPIRIIAYREWQANAEPLHSESSAIFTKTLYVSLYGYVSSRLRKMVNVIKKNSLERDSFYTPNFFFSFESVVTCNLVSKTAPSHLNITCD